MTTTYRMVFTYHDGRIRRYPKPRLAGALLDLADLRFAILARTYGAIATGCGTREWFRTRCSWRASPDLVGMTVTLEQQEVGAWTPIETGGRNDRDNNDGDLHR